MLNHERYNMHACPSFQLDHFLLYAHCPHRALLCHMIVLPVELNPSCLHTTSASGTPQKSSQTVPQVSSLQISTLPS